MFGHDDDDNQTNGVDPLNSSFGSPQNIAVSSADAPSDGGSVPVVNPSSDSTAATSLAHSAPAASNDLLNLKRDALSQLVPLVGHLNQTSEEKFKTTMMMIQATDNSALIKDAYTAAKQITDDKARAQALLDIVNEINYFTQHEAE